MMEDIILYYFTGTGNTGRLARTFRSAMECRGVTVSCREINRHSRGEDTAANGALGIFYPVYGLSMPPAVRHLLERLPRGNGRTAFILANAHTNSGLTRNKAVGILGRKGYMVVGSREVFMPTSSIITAETESEERAEEMRTLADGEIATFAEQLLEGRAPVDVGSITGRDRMVSLLFSLAMPGAAMKKISAGDRCTGCGRCTDICPNGNIRLRDGRPVWGRECEMCLRCLNYCPSEAIELMGSPGRRRYREPGFRPIVG